MKTLLLFLFGLAIPFFAFTQYDVNGNVISGGNTSSEEVFNFDHLELGQEANDCEWEEARLLTEINDPNEEDLYPWISSDGLRVYYTADVIGGGHDLFWMSRPHIDSTFRDIRPLSFNTFHREISCWLNEEELEIWFMRNNTLMYAQRPDRDSPFSQADSVVQLLGIDGFFIGPSLTPDQSQLFLYMINFDASVQEILIFDALAPNEYMFNSFLNVSNDIRPSPGQLSRDGYKYFFGTSINGAHKIACLTRDDLLNPFDFATYEELPVEINDSQFRNLYPSVTADGNTMVFARTIGGFDPAELAIAHRMDCATDTEEVLEENPFQLSIYPNPTAGDLTISWQNLEASEMQIVNLQGKILQSEAIQKQRVNELTLSVGDFPQGLYFCRLVVRNGWSETVKFVVE